MVTAIDRGGHGVGSARRGRLEPKHTCVASEIDALVATCAVIRDPRWRVEAAIRLQPVLEHHGLACERNDQILRDGLARAICPRAVRAPIGELVDQLARVRAPVAVQLRLVDALWSPSTAGALIGAIGIALWLRDMPRVRALEAQISDRHLRYRLAAYIRRGVLADGAFVGDLRERESETAYEPSLPLFIALVNEICSATDLARIDDAERLARRLRQHERGIAVAHLARLSSVAAAQTRARSIRDASVRAGAGYVLVQAAPTLDDAGRFAGAIETPLMRQRALLAIARARFERGEAFGTLRFVDQPALVAECALLRHEARLAAWSAKDRMPPVPVAAIQAARSAPAWTELAARVPPAVRERILESVALLRAMARADVDLPSLVGMSAVVGSTVARRAWLAACERLGLDPFAAIGAQRERSDARVVDPLLAELVGVRGERIVASGAALPEAFARGLHGERASGERGSLERALFDEGAIWSAHASRCRRAVIEAARHCVRGAIERPEAWPAEVVRVRTRTLAQLGGTLARDALAGALAIRPGTTTFFVETVTGLARIEPATATTAVFARARDGAEVVAALRVVERYGGVPAGFTRAWVVAHAALVRHAIAGAGVWLGKLVEERGVPSIALLEWIARRADVPPTPSALYADIHAVVGAIDRGRPAEAARRAAWEPDVLEALRLVREPRLDPRLRWPTWRWTELLGAAAAAAAEDLPLVARVARRLGRSREAIGLLHGGLGALVGVRTFALPRRDVSVRLLDKRADLLEYLRFADVKPATCYRSDSVSYYRTRRETLELWKDPLSVCFRVERADGRPRGFVFGGLAELDDRIALVLSGLYLDRRDDVLRADVIGAVEQLVCTPLGIRDVAVSGRYASAGPLPERYEWQRARITRLRALQRDGVPVSAIYDDVSSIVNGPVETWLYWARLW